MTLFQKNYAPVFAFWYVIYLHKSKDFQPQFEQMRIYFYAELHNSYMYVL